MARIIIAVTVCFAVIFTSTAICQAEESSATTLTVTLTDGARTHFSLWDNPKVTFSGEKLVVKWKTNAVDFPLEKVKYFTYDSTLAIDAVKTTKYFEREGDLIVFGKSVKERVVSLTGVNGILINQQKIKADETAALSLKDLSAGVYLLTVDGITSKITKK